MTIADTVYHHYIPDYQGNILAVVNTRTRQLEQRTDYYPYGMPHGSATGAGVNKRKYGGKELITFAGYDAMDYHARWRPTALPLFTTPDPLGGIDYGVSLYSYCNGDPVNRVDPSGMADFYENAKYLGSDGVNDGRVLVLRNGSSKGSISGADLASEQMEKAKEFIINNSNNIKAFESEGNFVYDRFIEVEASNENRKAMVDEVSKDDGTGGTKANNNREYGGEIREGQVKIVKPGDVCDLLKENVASIKLHSGFSTFHSHPSGDYDLNNGMVRGYNQYPSQTDLDIAQSYVHYMFARKSDKVYIYTSSGIQAEMSTSEFLKININRTR